MPMTLEEITAKAAERETAEKEAAAKAAAKPTDDAVKKVAEDAAKAEAEAKAKAEAEAKSARLETDLDGMFVAEKRNLEAAKKAKEDAKLLELAAARERSSAEKEKQQILEDAQREADALRQGPTLKARRQLAKELLDDGTWDKDRYNDYCEKHGLNKTPTTEDVEVIVSKTVQNALAPLVEALKAAQAKPVVLDQDPLKARTLEAAKKIMTAVPTLDVDDIKSLMKREWDKDPENFNPENAATSIIMRLGGKPAPAPADGDAGQAGEGKQRTPEDVDKDANELRKAMQISLRP